jgi:Ala-tRNA(Pro) deacylase
MSIANRVRRYLDEAEVDYETSTHIRTATSSETAQAAHIPGDLMAKAVVVHHEEGFLLAVAPATCRVDLGALQRFTERRLGLASEREADHLFADCATGAIPPLGEAYGLPTLVDHRLDRRSSIWFEGGDHRTLVKVNGRDFDRMLRHCPHGDFSVHM